MTKSKTTNVKNPDIKGKNEAVIEQEYSRELLINSQAIKSFGLHRDVLGAILSKPKYSIQNAKKAVENYIKSFEK